MVQSYLHCHRDGYGAQSSPQQFNCLLVLYLGCQQTKFDLTLNIGSTADTSAVNAQQETKAVSGKNCSMLTAESFQRLTALVEEVVAQTLVRNSEGKCEACIVISKPLLCKGQKSSAMKQWPVHVERV